MSTKWNLIIDIDKCNGCYNCFLVAKDEYVGNARPGYFASQPRHGHAWIDIDCVERGTFPACDVAYLPRMCNHCDDAPCLKAAVGGAVVKRDDGIVLIVPDKAKGQRQLVDACPYGAIWWNAEESLPQAWPFDAHLLDHGWTEPRCAQVCATGAIRAVRVTDDEMNRIVANEALRVLKPEHGTRPRVYYANLQRIHDRLLAGHVETVTPTGRDCVEGAEVTLLLGGQPLAVSRTDAYGDFRFSVSDGEEGSLSIRVEYGDGAALRSIEQHLGPEGFVDVVLDAGGVPALQG